METKAGEVTLVSFNSGFGMFTIYPNTVNSAEDAIQVTPMGNSKFTWDGVEVDADTVVNKLYAYKPIAGALFVKFIAYIGHKYIGCRSVDFTTK